MSFREIRRVGEAAVVRLLAQLRDFSEDAQASKKALNEMESKFE